MKAYRQQIKAATNAVKSAESKLSVAQVKFDMVEEFLTRYAWFDPAGYHEIDNLKDPQGITVDVYFGVDNRVCGTTGGWDANGVYQSSSGNHGTTDIGVIDEKTNGVLTKRIIKSAEHGKNSVYVALLKKTSDGTIAHEKYHIMFYVMNIKNMASDKDIDPNLDEPGAKEYEIEFNKRKPIKGPPSANFKRP